MPQAAIFPSVTIPKSAPGASSFDIILERCRDLVSERVSDALTAMFDEADEALTAFGSLSRDPETSKLYEVTRNKVLVQREAIVEQFRVRFIREFHERVNRVKKIGDKFAEIDLSSLTPVAEDNQHESLKFDAMASRLRQYCDEELLALDQRVGVLVGDADLQSDDNPFTPQAIVDAYKDTCRQIDSNVDVRLVLLKLFDDYVLDEIRGVYKAVNTLLIKNSILPKIRFSVERSKDAAKAPSVESKPGKSSGTPVTTTAPRGRRKTDQDIGRNQMDTMTLDIMVMLLDELFDDPRIPTIVKGLIGRVQTPMLKLVIADKSFFSKKSHPARQMLEKLGELSTGLPADINQSDPIYAKLESIVQSLNEEFEDGIDIFDRMGQQLDTLIVDVNQRGKEETQPIAKPVEQKVVLAVEQNAAEAEIEARLRASTVPQPIVEFLERHWVKLLDTIHANEGEDSEAWKNALTTMDLLIWSGERKETQEERSEMVAVLPELLKSLTEGLAHAGIDDSIRVKFLSDLRKLHSALIGRSARPGAEKTEPSVTNEEPEAVPVQEAPAEADPRQEMMLDFVPAGGEPAAIPNVAKTATANTAALEAKMAALEAKTAALETKTATPKAKTAVPEAKSPTARTNQEPSAQLRAEMDRAMDATRTMFSDVDRFIMLGQTQNAINVLQSRIEREPADRDSWIKLMAIFRDMGMQDDFYRTHVAFLEHHG